MCGGGSTCKVRSTGKERTQSLSPGEILQEFPTEGKRGRDLVSQSDTALFTVQTTDYSLSKQNKQKKQTNKQTVKASPGLL